MSDTADFSDSPTVPGTLGSNPRTAAGAVGALAANATIGPYRILSHIGDGGFGSVYLAEQTHPVRRRVAIKILKVGMNTPALVARFEAERQMLVMMDHPGVAKVFDAGVTQEGRSYVAMEYVAGESVSRFCEKERLGVDDRVRLMIKVCNAVHHAHMKGVIHRDLKPGNILVELVDGTPAPRVIDFGVAKALDRSLADSAVVTEYGQMVGTPEYMPPEQARGTTVDIDTRADVYSLGAVLYELLTGVTPLDSRLLRRAGYAEMQRMIEHEVPVLPSQRLTAIKSVGAVHDSGTVASIRRVRRDLDWIVMRCLEKDRARRYESAAALARDLERYLDDEVVDAGPPSLSYRASKFVRRNKVVVAAAVFSLVIAAGAFGLTVWALERAIAEQKVADGQRREALQARDEAEGVTKFLTGILESVQPEVSGREVTVRQVLDEASMKLNNEQGVNPLLDARLRLTLGTSYLALGVLDRAERHLAAGVETRASNLGPDSVLTVQAKFNLAALYHAQGRMEQARQLYEECLDLWSRMGAESIAAGDQSLGAMNNLAQIALNQGRLEDAEKLQRRTIAAMESTLGPTHEHTLGAKTNLGSILREQGKLDAAEKTLRDVEKSWSATFGAEHPGTLLAMHNLALAYLDAGRHGEAADMSRKLVEVRSRVLGEDHLDTIAAVANLGLVLAASGSPEAEAAYVKAWDASRRVLGEEHPTTLTTGLNLMSMYERMGWPSSSTAVVERLMGTLRSIAQQPDSTAGELNSSAWMLLTARPESVQQPSIALAAAVRACDVERASGGRNLWEYLDTLAMAYARTGAAAHAVEAQREAIKLVPPTAAAQAFVKEMTERLAQYEGMLRK